MGEGDNYKIAVCGISSKQSGGGEQRMAYKIQDCFKSLPIRLGRTNFLAGSHSNCRLIWQPTDHQFGFSTDNNDMGGTRKQPCRL